MATDLWYDADLRLRFGVVPLGTIALKPVQEILQPRKQPFNLPTSAIPSQATQVLGRIFSIHAVRGDQFNSVSAKLAIQFVGVIGIVAY